MKVRLAAGAVTLLAGVLVAGCGGGSGDSLTLEEYLQEFHAIEVEVDAQMADVYGAYPDEEATLMEDEANLPLLKELAAGFPPVMAFFRDEIAALDPPSETEASHAAMVAAANEVAMLFDDGVERLEEAQTMAEFKALNTQVDGTLEAAFSRFDDACFDLALLAADNDIEVELDCAE